VSGTDHIDWAIEMIVDAGDNDELARAVASNLGYIVGAGDAMPEIAWRMFTAHGARLREFHDMYFIQSSVFAERRLAERMAAPQ
jgi:hypothetical protein